MVAQGPLGSTPPAEDAPAPEDSARIPPPHDARLGAADAQILAWAFVALLDAIAIVVVVPMQRGRLGLRAAHLFYDAGHVLVLGVVSAVVVALWGRIRPRVSPEAPRRRAFLLGGFLDTPSSRSVSIALGFFCLDDDLGNLAGRLVAARPISVSIVLSLLIVGVSLGVPAAAQIGRLLDRPRLRWIGALAIPGVVIANHLVLVADYPGAHLYLVWAGAACGGAALAGLPLPERFALPSRALFAAGIGARAALAVAAALSIAIWPSPSILTQLYRGGAVLTPFLARLRQEREGRAEVSIPPALTEWFTDRSTAPAIPSTAKAPPDRIVLLFFIDSLRSDVLASDKNAATLPVLTGLKRDGIYFPHARAPGAGTVLYAHGRLREPVFFANVLVREAPGRLLGLSRQVDTLPRGARQGRDPYRDVREHALAHQLVRRRARVHRGDGDGSEDHP